jgi:hypothetical protein
MAHNFRNWLGLRSGRLLITEHLGKDDSGNHHMWLAVCDCGNTKTVKSRELNAGDTKSCGCLKKEVVGKINAEFTEKYRTHGWSGTPEHRAWKRAKGRVFNPNNEDYPVYSLLGMEESWQKDFMEFLADMGEMPKDGQRWSVGRIDNKVGYVKGNVRWEVDSQQAKNKGKYKNNNTGETGVYWNRVRNSEANTDTTYAVATWYDKEGNQRSRSYSVSRYGIMEAFALAVKKRREMMEELKKQGVIYGEHHGK